MIKYVYRYPDGAVGVALLLVRMCYAFVAFGIASVLSAISASTPLLYPAAGLIALLLVIGFATRLASLFLGIAVVVALIVSSPAHQMLLAGHVGGCAAIVMMGAGAFSIDARRHGRRVIQLQANTPDRGSPDRGGVD
jgi:putative oxidoreductase